MLPERTILTIDFGNTAMKAAVFEGERLVQSVVGTGSTHEAVDALQTFHSVEGICYCCVGADRENLLEHLRHTGLPMVALGPETPLPIEVCYGSRATLGADRLAAAVGVAGEEEAVLVVDAGTAVTCDLVADRRFLGGNISPGLKLRFHSLHEFTSRLPLVSPDGELPVFGHDTQTAIRAGVMNGLVWELAGAFETARSEYKNIKMVITGGDAAILAPLLAEHGIEAVADSETVGRGLVRIFNYNNDL
jgi:type III pantothenate kinase